MAEPGTDNATDNDQANRIEAKLDRILSTTEKVEAVLAGMESNPMLRMLAKRMGANGDSGMTVPVGDSLPGGTQ